MKITKDLIRNLATTGPGEPTCFNDVADRIADGLAIVERVSAERAKLEAQTRAEIDRHEQAMGHLGRLVGEMRKACPHPVTEVHRGANGESYRECGVCGGELNA